MLPSLCLEPSSPYKCPPKEKRTFCHVLRHSAPISFGKQKLSFNDSKSEKKTEPLKGRLKTPLKARSQVKLAQPSGSNTPTKSQDSNKQILEQIPQTPESKPLEKNLMLPFPLINEKEEFIQSNKPIKNRYQLFESELQAICLQMERCLEKLNNEEDTLEDSVHPTLGGMSNSIPSSKKLMDLLFGLNRKAMEFLESGFQITGYPDL